MNVNTWATPVGNVIANVQDPAGSALYGPSGSGNFSAVICAWNGAAWDPTRRKMFMLANGGHVNYGGNEVYAIDFSVNSPVWSRPRNATTPLPAGGQNYTQYSDGRPSSNHTYNSHAVIYPLARTPNTGRPVLLGLGSVYEQGARGHGRWFEFDVNNTGASISGQNNDWIDRGSNKINGTNGSFPGSIANVWDPADQLMIHFDGGNSSAAGLFWVNPTTFAITTSRNDSINDNSWGVAMAVDTTNHILIIYHNELPNPGIRILNLANKTGSFQFIPKASIGGTGPAWKDLGEDFGALWWHAPYNAFVTWAGNGTSGVKKLTPTLGGGSYSALTWSDVPLGSGGVTQPSYAAATDPSIGGATKGMWNKIGYFPDMGNGQAGLFAITKYGAPEVYAFKL